MTLVVSLVICGKKATLDKPDTFPPRQWTPCLNSIGQVNGIMGSSSMPSRSSACGGTLGGVDEMVDAAIWWAVTFVVGGSMNPESS